MKNENIFGLDVVSFNVEDALPPKRSYVIAKLVDSVSKKAKLRSSYYDNGVFWDSESSHASGIEHSSSECDDEETLIYNWEVVSWFKADFS